MLDYKDFNILQYVWDYFQLHAEQRLKTFEFYIVIATVLLSGYAISLKENNLMPIGIILGLLLTILSFVFWKLDVRNRQLIKNAEQALKTIEKGLVLDRTGDTPHNLELINYDDYKVRQERNRHCSLFWQKHFSYSKCFNIMFSVFAILGIIAAFWTCCCLVKHSRKSIGSDVKPVSVVVDDDYTEIKSSTSGDVKRK